MGTPRRRGHRSAISSWPSSAAPTTPARPATAEASSLGHAFRGQRPTVRPDGRGPMPRADEGVSPTRSAAQHAAVTGARPGQPTGRDPGPPSSVIRSRRPAQRPATRRSHHTGRIDRPFGFSCRSTLTCNRTDLRASPMIMTARGRPPLLATVDLPGCPPVDTVDGWRLAHYTLRGGRLRAAQRSPRSPVNGGGQDCSSRRSGADQTCQLPDMS
jgi:hypothetical protein